MYMIEITESKISQLSELAEKMLKYGGKLMQCIEDIDNDSRIGHRQPMPDYRDEWRHRDYDDEAYQERYAERNAYPRRRRY